MIMARPPPKMDDYVKSEKNNVIFSRSYDSWMHKDVGDIREGLKLRAAKATEGDSNEKQHLRLSKKVMHYVV